MKKLSTLFALFIFLFTTANAQYYQWAKNIGGTANDKAKIVKTDANDNVYVAGTFNDLVDFDPGTATANLQGKGWGDIFVAKYTATGEYQWAFALGESSSDDIYDLIIDNENNIIITGAFSDSIDLDPGPGKATFMGDFFGNTDGFVAKYTSSGNYIWGFSFGNINVDHGENLAVNANNDIYLAGYFNQSVDFDPGAGDASLNGQFDIFVAKYDEDGNFIWVFQIGANAQENTHGIALDPNENLCVYGRFQQTVDFDPGSGTANLTASSNHDLFIAKYTPSGNYVWAKQLSGSGPKYGKGISIDPNGNIYIGGSFGQNMDFDPSGNSATVSSTYVSPFAAKYNDQGDYIWSHVFLCSTGGSAQSGNVQYNNNNLYIVGNFNGSLNDTINNNPVSMASQGAEDIFLGKLNASDGKAIWINTTGSSDLDLASDVAVLNSDIFFVCGIFQQTCDFNFDTQVTSNLNSNGQGDAFFAKYSETNLGIDNLFHKSVVFQIYPNPNNGQFTIQTDKESVFELMDITGRVINTYRVKGGLDVSENLPGGMYYIRETENGIIQKLIIN